MWRIVLIIIMLLGLLGGAVVAPPVASQETGELGVDLAAMPVPPASLPEIGYQFARGGYLTPNDARYLTGQRYDLDGDAIDNLFASVSWRQGYTGTYVLLSDRSYRDSDPLASVTTTIHELETGDGATAIEALMGGAPPKGAEDRDPAVSGATTWRVVSSQADMLVTIVRSDRFVLEITSADWARTPDAAAHAAIVAATLDRVERVGGGDDSLSQQFVLLEDDRLVPVAVATDSPLVHAWYRLLDGEVIPAAGELGLPTASEIAPGVDRIAISRQTAELSSQNWVTAGIVIARFQSPTDASAFATGDGVIRDPLDVFPETEDRGAAEPSTTSGRVEAISGKTRVGGRYSGYRITVVDDATVAQLTIRSMGSTLLDREAVEGWAEAQRDCSGGGACDPAPLETLLRTPDPATPVAGDDEDGAYRSPVAPWAVTFDPAVWEVDETFAQGGYDYLYLRSERMDATFETIVDHRGDPEQCVLDELDLLREDESRARIDVGSSDEGEEAGGLTEGHGWIVYTVEPLEETRADQEYVIRIDCYTVIEGSTSLVVKVRAPADAWAELAPLGEALRSQIEIEGEPASRGTGDLLAAAPIMRRDEMINRRPWVGIAA